MILVYLLILYMLINPVMFYLEARKYGLETWGDLVACLFFSIFWLILIPGMKFFDILGNLADILNRPLPWKTKTSQ